MEKNSFKITCKDCGAEYISDPTTVNPIQIYPEFTDNANEIITSNDYFISCSRCMNRDKIYINGK